MTERTMCVVCCPGSQRGGPGAELASTVAGAVPPCQRAAKPGFTMPGLSPDRASDVQRPMTSDSPTPERSGMMADFWPHVWSVQQAAESGVGVSDIHWPHSDADSFGSGGLSRASQNPQRAMLSVSRLMPVWAGRSLAASGSPPLSLTVSRRSGRRNAMEAESEKLEWSGAAGKLRVRPAAPGTVPPLGAK